LLRAEGFTDIRYDDTSEIGAIAPVAHGRVDFAPIYASQSVRAIDAGERVTLLAGVMVGCFELFAREGIDSVAELKGQSIGVGAAGSLSQQLVTLMAAQVGVDPVNDVHWITDPKVKPLDLFAEGKIDAFLAYPPDSQELRARHAGHVILDTTVDRPWSQYFCCMVAANRKYILRYPVATKRALRAILRAADLCVSDPSAVARKLVNESRASMTMPSRRSAKSITTNGGTTTPKIPSGSMRCGCMKRV
jgi:NitT/TauT family transport system substrate-binding protein